RLKDDILKPYLQDDACARHMRSDGSYSPKSRECGFNSQSWFLGQAARTAPIGRTRREANTTGLKRGPRTPIAIVDHRNPTAPRGTYDVLRKRVDGVLTLMRARRETNARQPA